MKKCILFCLLLCLVFLCTGCEGDITRGIRHAGYNLSGSDLICNDIITKYNNTDYTKIKFLTSNLAIMSDDRIYEFSFSKQYSSGQNCRISVFDKKVISIFNSNVAKCDDGYYTLVTNGDVPAFSKLSDVSLYDIILGEDVVKAVSVDESSGIYYLLKGDGNIYKYVVSKNNNSYSLVSSEVIYSKETFGYIYDFGYSDENPLGTYIRTDEKIYRKIVSNSNECQKYADISCKYEFVEDADLIVYDDYILGYNGTTLITNYGRVFVNAG